MPPIRVLLVDDHVVVRRGLRSMLAGADDIQVIGEASNGKDAMEQVAALAPDVVLLDIRMPGMDGLQLLRVLRANQQEIRIIVLTAYAEEQFVTTAFQAGADGYLLKNVGRDELLKALNAVCRGKRTLSEELMDGFLRKLWDTDQRNPREQFGLSTRDVELLKLVADGATNRSIAKQLYWSEATVKRKLSDIFHKLDVFDRAQAVAVAVRLGIL